MMDWVLLLFMVTTSGGASSIAIDMPDYKQCGAARDQVLQQDNAYHDRDERVVKLAICIQRND